MVLGCHFGRSEKPFVYDVMGNKYHQFSDKDIFIDMYRSNDVVQFNSKSIYIRPFVKVGEKAKSVKVHQYFIEDANTHQADIKIQYLSKLEQCTNCQKSAVNNSLRQEMPGFNNPE